VETPTWCDLIADEHALCTCGVIVAEVFQGLRRE